MSDSPAVDFDELRYIKLRGDGSKLPAKSWGGYSQDFDDAKHVRTHDEVKMLPDDHWGIVDIMVEDARPSFALLIFDIDVHKAPDDFEPDRLKVPTDTLVTRSQNGGFHVYFALTGYRRGALNESDFQMPVDPGFDIDIRGSVVSHHVVAPADIPGVGGQYEIVNDEPIKRLLDPVDAAEAISLDDEAALEFGPDSGGIDYDFEVPSEPPEEMPTCYHAGLELRKESPDDHPNTHKVNVLAASCGLAAGFDPETVAGHFCGEWSPYGGQADLSDRETTEYQVSHIAESGYAPPSEQTLRDYGILPEDEHCDRDCPVDYHGPRDDERPDLDVLQGEERGFAAEAAAVAGEPVSAETDGGTAAVSNSSDGPERTFESDVRHAIREFNDDEIQAKTARHRIAQALTEHHNFVYPEEEVQGWRETLYAYNPREGIYEPRGGVKIKKLLERAAGDFVDNQTCNEIMAKVERMTTRRGELFATEPQRIVVGNGILDLHTGTLSSYTPDEYHQQKIEVDWRPDAGEPEAIDSFLHDIVDDDDVVTLYRLVAHTVYKEYIGEKAAMLIGGGSNGKSMFLDLLETFLSRSNVSHRELQDFDDDGFAANNLQGKLANLASEIGEQELEDTTSFKKLTGRDTLDARVKFERPVTFENYATLAFATNEMPVFGQDNHAIWRRWLYIEFPYTFDADDPDSKDPEPEHVIKDRLTQEHELEALLLRCQQEIERWHNDHDEAFFANAMDADDVRQKMKKAAEPVFAFASECLVSGEDEYVEKSVVRAAYRAFADEEELPRIPDNEFGQRILSLSDPRVESGERRVDGQQHYVYEGVCLSSRGRQVLGLDEPSEEEQSTVDGEYQQHSKALLELLNEMVEENGGDPVPREGVVWGAAGDMGKSTASRILDELIEEGDVFEPAGENGVLPMPN